MATLTARIMGNIYEEHKIVHPFFERPCRPLPVPSVSGDIRGNEITEQLSVNSVWEPRGNSISPNRDGTWNSTNYVEQTCNQEPKVAELLQADLNRDRRKRRKAASPRNKITNYASMESDRSSGVSADEKSLQDLNIPQLQTRGVPAIGDCVEEHANSMRNLLDFPDDNLPQSLTRTSTTLPDSVLRSAASNLESTEDLIAEQVTKQSVANIGSEPEDQLGPRTSKKPRKLLQLNPKTGTIGSPPLKRSARLKDTAVSVIQPAKRRKNAPSLVVTIKYGQDQSTRYVIGERIDLLRAASKAVVNPLSKATELLESRYLTESKRSTHPFFLAKPIHQETSKACSAPALAENEVPIIKLKAVKRVITSVNGSRSPSRKPDQGSRFLGFAGNAVKMMKFPGAVEPVWPPRGMVHLRESSQGLSMNDTLPQTTLGDRKSKYAATETLAEEDIIKALSVDLDIENVARSLQHVDTDEYPDPSPHLRLPERHFETGIQLQQRIQRELRLSPPSTQISRSASSSEDELMGSGRPPSPIHPALMKVYNAITTSLTAFDQSQYETQSWIHKYAPSSAAEVLQTGKEASILKDWLLSQIIIAVDNGAGDSGQSRGTSVASKRSVASKSEGYGKRKRKNKLEGFVVSSDEEMNEMDEISEPDEDSSPRGSQGLLKKTVIRAGDAAAKYSKELIKVMNAVVISGPSGCGKTAMVQAVAKELGFEIFEINSSSKRSGKDVLERVGDLTRNHLVQSSAELGTVTPQNEDYQRVTDALDADLISGRQGTMNSFFRPKISTKGNPNDLASGRKQVKDNESEKPIKTLPKAPKQQKQSLILLEEIDILFEDDKQFWPTVMTMISQSKRPIIMTCNDEALVPLQALPLHAIIRMSPPPTDMTVDYMLLVAANEGHILQRKAVRALYEAKSHDIRASMTELEFWCQIGVGDRRGGFDWFYPRLPAGVDRNALGDTIRVVSEGTYKTGMGWLGRDSFSGRLTEKFEEGIIREAFESDQLDVGDWHDTLDLESWASKLQLWSDDKVSHRHALSAYESFTESLSDADVFAYRGLATGNDAWLDTTIPPLPSKSRDDFIIGQELLQADRLVRYSNLHISINTSIKSLARQTLQTTFQHLTRQPHTELNPVTESHLITHLTRPPLQRPLTRHTFSIAFDPLASSPSYIWSTTSALEPSTFDRPLPILTTDLAPFIRSIVSYDLDLQAARAKLSNLLSHGGGSSASRRMRTTRASLSALEGGKRQHTRRERWFGDRLNYVDVLATGGVAWREALKRAMGREARDESVARVVEEKEEETMSESE